MNYPATIIIRHARENIKKCSLRGLEKRSDFNFFTYPYCVLGKETLPDLTGYIVLDVEGEELSEKDNTSGILLLDGTWRLAEKMQKNISQLEGLVKRSIPAGFKTAYPRRQDDCPDPDAGLASIEALYIAYLAAKRPTEGLFDDYHWKDQFLSKNEQLISAF
jgi:pre-rRNA-processing protein TSR3